MIKLNSQYKHSILRLDYIFIFLSSQIKFYSFSLFFEYHIRRRSFNTNVFCSFLHADSIVNNFSDLKFSNSSDTWGFLSSASFRLVRDMFMKKTSNFIIKNTIICQIFIVSHKIFNFDFLIDIIILKSPALYFKSVKFIWKSAHFIWKSVKLIWEMLYKYLKNNFYKVFNKQYFRKMINCK